MNGLQKALKNYLHIRRSLYWRLSSVLLLLLVIIGTSDFVSRYYFSVLYREYAKQHINASLAQTVAHVLEPYLVEPINEMLVLRKLAELSAVNPEIGIYLIDADGRILMTTESIIRPAVRVEPILRFINLKGGTWEPIYGDEPTSRPDKPMGKAVFSAAPITIAGTPGYVYIPLSNLATLQVYSVLGEYYMERVPLAWLLLSFGSVGLLGLFIFKRLTARLTKMVAAVEEFRTGSYEKRIPFTGPDEIGRLAAAFNTMADTIEQSIFALEEKDRLRRDLVANVSHDLRGPLTSISGFVQRLQLKDQEGMPDADKAGYIELIAKNVKHLKLLLDNLFELAKIEAKEAPLTLEVFPINELIDEIIHRLAPQAEEKQITLTLETESERSDVEADLGKIERVLINLIENALRYTPAGGSVVVKTLDAGDHLQVEVRDTGEGIPAADLPHIFDRFYRVDKHRSKVTGGSGLGLAIVKSIIERHGTEITIDSELGVGTVVRFALPQK